MTTEQIRKNISVNTYFIVNAGLLITYFTDPQYKLADSCNTYSLPPIQTLQLLEKIGSIKKFEADPIRVWWDTVKGTAVHGSWEVFCNHFVLSQYEALNLIIRHEYEQSLKSDMNLLEMDKALEALK